MFYSPRCEHCLEANKILENTPYADQIEYLNVHQTEIPSEYKKELTHVPAIITNEGKLLVGTEVRQWALSLIPTEIESFDARAIASLTEIRVWFKGYLILNPMVFHWRLR